MRKTLAPPPAGAGLTVVTGLASDFTLDSNHPLKCFVDGQPVGEMPLGDCARRNGVSNGALDLGLDAGGQLGASNGLTAALTPLPPRGDAPTSDSGASGAGSSGGGLAQGVSEASRGDANEAANPIVGGCWRYGEGGWARGDVEMSLGACIQTLFGGQCLAPGAVAYGRWRNHTLRLIPGQVDMMGDDRSFRFVATQAGDCSIASSP